MPHPCFAGFLNYLQMLNFHKPLKTRSALEIILLIMVVVCVLCKNSAIKINSQDHKVSSTKYHARGSTQVPPWRTAGPILPLWAGMFSLHPLRLWQDWIIMDTLVNE